MTNVTQQNYILLEPSVSQLPGNLLESTNGKVNIGNNIGDVTSFVFVTLVTASLVAAVFMVMRGSFTRFTSDSVYKHTEGNEMIRRAVFGLLAVLTMYLTILTINPDMLRKGLNLPSYQTTQDITSIISPNAYISDPSINPASNTPRPFSPIPVTTDAINRKILEDAKIYTNHPGGDCTAEQWADINGNPSCTSLEGLPRDTVNMLLSLKNDCGGDVCGIIITGGTEPGHKSHGKGLYPVDLNCSVNGASCFSSSSRLNTYIKSLTELNPTLSICNHTYGPYKTNFFFCDENVSKTGSGAPHWHLVHY